VTRLALVMIARDEARCIARALQSVRAHVDAMIVLDTGSVDDTMAIARSCGAQVHSFAWGDDFAAARNAALNHSDADWNLVLDADEWLEGKAGALKLLAFAGDEPFIGQVRIESQMDAEGAGRAWIPRLLPRGVRYEGRIHEQPKSDLPQVRLPVHFGHDGYLADNLARKGSRNETLLLAEIEARPEDPYLWLQLGREYQARAKPPQAAVCLAEALRLCPSDAPFRHSLVVRAITAFKAAERFDEAVELTETQAQHWKHSPDFFFAVGDLFLELGSRFPERALDEFLPVAEGAWKICLEIGEQDGLDGSVAGRGSHMPAHNLSVIYEGLGQADLARKYKALAVALKTTLNRAA
jgi:tetratricopeptide (TPR) repeat protein